MLNLKIGWQILRQVCTVFFFSFITLFLRIFQLTRFPSLVSCKINNAFGQPSKKAIWTTTALGDVYVYDPAITEVVCLVLVYETLQRNKRFNCIFTGESIRRRFLLPRIRHSWKEFTI